jgi:hypothetical protein
MKCIDCRDILLSHNKATNDDKATELLTILRERSETDFVKFFDVACRLRNNALRELLQPYIDEYRRGGASSASGPSLQGSSTNAAALQGTSKPSSPEDSLVRVYARSRCEERTVSLVQINKEKRLPSAVDERISTGLGQRFCSTSTQQQVTTVSHFAEPIRCLFIARSQEALKSSHRSQ